MKKIKIGLVGVYLTKFNVSLALNEYQRAIRALEKLSRETEIFDFYPIPKPLISKEEAIKAQRQMEEQNLDFLIIHHSSFSSGEIILPLAEIDTYLGMWAIPEPTEEGPLPLGSLVGVNMYASILGHYLRDYKIRFKWFFGSPESETFIESFKVTLKAIRTIKSLRDSRIGLIGGIAQGFYDLYFDERRLRSIYGVSVYTHELSEVLKKAESYSENKIGRLIEDIKTEGQSKNIDKKYFEKAARVYLALEEISRENGYEALAISCWPKFQDEYEFAPCSTIGRLNQNGIVAACEGDILGALSMLILNYLNDNKYPATIMDLPKFDMKDDSLLLWHCGPSAQWWANDKGMTYCTHFNLGVRRPDGSFQKVGIVNDLIFKEQDVTIMRIVNDGTRMLLTTGRTIDQNKKSYDGSRGWLGEVRMINKKVSALDFVNTVIVYRLPHHFPLALGNLGDELMEISSWLGVEPLEPVPYRKYMQNPR